MNPTNNNEAIQLPAPVTERGPAAGDQAEKRPSGAENAPSGEISAQAAPAAMPTSIPLPTPPAMPAAPASLASNATQANPAQASDDTDLIEKEWVNKAKAIVERTRDDPHKQSEELTVFKADYMKKRYNKAVKLSK